MQDRMQCVSAVDGSVAPQCLGDAITEALTREGPEVNIATAPDAPMEEVLRALLQRMADVDDALHTVMAGDIDGRAAILGKDDQGRSRPIRIVSLLNGDAYTMDRVLAVRRALFDAVGGDSGAYDVRGYFPFRVAGLVFGDRQECLPAGLASVRLQFLPFGFMMRLLYRIDETAPTRSGE